MAKQEKQSCFCFPETQKLLEEYHRHLTDRYLAEKTSKTITTWLNTSAKRSYDVVPIYAVSDFEDYVCKSGPKELCTAAKMNANMNYIKIKEVLDQIARPCPCDK